jgi:hypothetical protein
MLKSRCARLLGFQIKMLTAGRGGTTVLAQISSKNFDGFWVR